jgi:Tol biopolymer transport system component
MKRNWILPPILALSVVAMALLIDVVAAGGSGYLTRVTTASDDQRASQYPSLSADGRLVAFQSTSDFLSQGIPVWRNEIWLYDTTTMSLTRITTASGSNETSFIPGISADGRTVAFSSSSNFLGGDVPPALHQEIWLYDTVTMTYTRVTTTADSQHRESSHPSLSGGGTVVAFDGNADFLDQGIQTGQREVWLYNTATMTLTRVTTASDDNRRSTSPSLSADGTRVAFSSDSDFLDQGIPDDQHEIWLYDTAAMTYTRVTTASGEDRSSWVPSLSADGSVVAFVSNSDFLAQGIPQGQSEIWLCDTATMSLTRITTASDVDRYSVQPSLNADGTIVAFESDSDFLGEGISDNQFEIWLYDTTTMRFARVTEVSGAEWGSRWPSLSADGTVVAFQSDSDFLSQGIPEWQKEIWLHRPYDHQVYLPLVLRNAP